MKIIQLNYSDINGGAARAAYRIHHALRRAGIDTRMLVNHATAGDWTVDGPASKMEKLVVMLREHIGGQLRHTLKTGNPIIHSPAFLPSRWPARLNASEVDLVHLHSTAGEMLSVADIGCIRKPLLWTLHDMWAFCGAEHYTEEFRWLDGYRKDNRPVYESGFDLNRWTWARKRKHWQRPFQIVTPSRWLADCARQSTLMRDWPIVVIPNALDTDLWQPIQKRLARELLVLPQDEPLMLFGAMGGGRDPRKGFDLLVTALRHLRGEIKGMRLLVFGQLAPKESPDLGFPVHYTGHLHDDLSLRAIYSAADALVIPSRQDNLPNTAVEALACGTPVIAFDSCGMPDIVDHQHTGYLARAFDTEDLAQGIRWVMQAHDDAISDHSGTVKSQSVTNGANETATQSWLGINARQQAVARFSYPVVADEYARLYTSLI